MNSTGNWWTGEIDWSTPAGQLLQKFLASLPKERRFHFTLYGSGPLQLTVDRRLMSADVDLFSDDDQDLASLIEQARLGKSGGGYYLEAGFELSFRTSPRWRQRAKTVVLDNVTLTIPHPLDILIGKINRLEEKDLGAFSSVRELTGHPTAEELLGELRQAVDLFRPAFEEDSPNHFPENTLKLWQQIYQSSIDVRKDIIEPALAQRKQGYGEAPRNYKRALERPF